MAMPDINQLDLASEKVEVASNVNYETFFQFPLLDDGDHTAVLHLGDKGVQKKAGKPKDGQAGANYLTVHLQAKVLNDQGEEKGGTVFDSGITSIIMQSTGSSRLHAVMYMAGHPVPPEVNTLDALKTFVEEALAQSPQVKITTQWEASYKVETPDEATATGKKIDEYAIVKRGQKNFPKLFDADGNDTGKYNPHITDPRTGREADAQVRISKYARA